MAQATRSDLLGIAPPRLLGSLASHPIAQIKATVLPVPIFLCNRIATLIIGVVDPTKFNERVGLNNR